MTKRRQRAVDKTFSKVLKNYQPPEPLTVSQWAEKYRVLSRESSAEAGPWRNARTPYLVEPMNALTQPQVRQIAIVAPSQVGKSELELNAIGYIIDQDPGSMLYIQPTIGDAKKFSRLRIAPMIRDSKKLRSKVSDIKSRDSGNTQLQKSFPGGMLTIIGSQSAAALASTPSRYIIGDELDRWAKSAGTEGDPWGLAAARTTTYYNAKMIAVSSPTIKGFSKIEELYNEGTQERWCTKCPDCGEYHCIKFDDIKFKFETHRTKRSVSYEIQSVGWACPSCGSYHTEEEMREQPSKWVPENPTAIQRGKRSFWINAFSSPWRPWESIVVDFLETRKDPERFQVFYNTVLGELWEDRGDMVTDDEMLSRREDYGKNKDGTPVELPEGVLVLTCGVDVQDDRLEAEVVGWGHYKESWGIRKYIFYGDPNDEEVWRQLDDILDHVYKFENGRGLTIAQTFIDSGGHKTQSVYFHCRERIYRRVFAIKGKGGEGVPFVRVPSKVDVIVNGRSIAKAYLYTLGVDAGKATIMSSIRVQEPGPKYCHFPLNQEAGYNADFFNGLLSEKLVQKVEKGRMRMYWEKLPGHERNEALDCRNYALAAITALDPDFEAVERRLKGLEPERLQAQPAKSKVSRNKILSSDEW